MCAKGKNRMKSHELQPSNIPAIKGLLAHGPNPEMAEKLMLFGQFVGDWDILEDRFYDSNGTRSLEENLTRGELHWGWVLDGRAVQDVWMSIDEKTGRAKSEGTTIRFYDEKIDAWQSIWISPTQGSVKKFVARQVGDEIVLEGKTTDGYPLRWIFSDITPNSFRWRAEESRDDGKDWTIREEMQIRRRQQSQGSEITGLLDG